MKYVTIATDISNKGKVSTWAVYIRHGGGVIKESGQFNKYHRHTYTAETYALLNALVIAHKNVQDWENSRIIIYNEIDYVLKPILTKAGNIKKRDAKRADNITNIALPILSEAASWELRGVKAHYQDWKISDNPKKYFMNRWCDQESRRLARQICFDKEWGFAFPKNE